MNLKLPKFIKKGEANQQQTPSGSGSTLKAFWSMAFVGVVLALILAAAMLIGLDAQRMQGVGQKRVDSDFQALGRSQSHTLSMYYKSLQGLSADADLVALLTGAEHAEWPSLERILTSLIPGALRVRLLLPEHDTTDISAATPLSFASLDLLRAAEKATKPPPLELHHAGTPQVHLAAAAALRNGRGEIVGLVHLALNAKFLRTGLNGLPAGQGRVELQQLVNGKYVTLFANSGKAVTGGADMIHPLRNSRLRLVHRPAPYPGLDSQVIYLIAAVLLAALLLATLSLALQYYRMRKAVDHDKALIVRMLDESLAGRSVHKEPLKVRDFHDVMALLMHRLNMPESIAQDTSTAAVSAADESGRLQPVDPKSFLTQLPEVIFRAYDIRGVVDDTLTFPVVHTIGRAIGSHSYEQGQQTVIVARDARESSPKFEEALIEGLTASGCDVIELGLVPVPVLYFATHFLGSDSGVMITGSHNSQEYNGLKVVLGGESLAGADLLALRERVELGNLLEGSGAAQSQDLLPDYINRIGEDISIARPLKIVIDCGSGCTSLVAPALFRSLGCEVVKLYCEVNNEYPGHHPDPSRPENLAELREAVVREDADIGLAFNGDGDRLGVVDSQGNIIWPDRLLMLLSADVLARHPGGDVVFDVKCSRALASQILQNGGRPVMWKSGHYQLKTKLRETGALLAGEWSGHIIFGERWYGFDDALYASARLLEILAVDPRSSAEAFAELPEFVSTPELYLPVKEGEQHELMDKAQLRFDLLKDAKLITIDGIRAELEDAWGLMRASNSSPALSFRFEADSEQALKRVQGLYRTLLSSIAPALKPPF